VAADDTGDLVDGERDARVRHVDDEVDLVRVVPLPRDLRADVRLVLVVGEDDLDLHPLLVGAVVRDSHPGGHHRALAGEVGVEAGLVVEDADLDDAVRDLSVRGGADGEQRRQHGESSDDSHGL
jgi:hypothetical protein